MKKIWLILMLLIASAAWAAPEKASRPAAKEDLAGTWDMVSVKPVQDKKDPVFFPYQRFVFNKDSSMKYMVSDKPFVEEWLEKFNKQRPAIDYSVSAKGLLTLTWQDQPHNETALCAYVLRDVPAEVLAKLPVGERDRVPGQGDITLSFLNSSGHIAYQKVLKKIA